MENIEQTLQIKITEKIKTGFDRVSKVYSEGFHQHKHKMYFTQFLNNPENFESEIIKKNKDEVIVETTFNIKLKIFDTKENLIKNAKQRIEDLLSFVIDGRTIYYVDVSIV